MNHFPLLCMSELTIHFMLSLYMWLFNSFLVITEMQEYLCYLLNFKLTDRTEQKSDAEANQPISFFI